MIKQQQLAGTNLLANVKKQVAGIKGKPAGGDKKQPFSMTAVNLVRKRN